MLLKGKNKMWYRFNRLLCFPDIISKTFVIRTIGFTHTKIEVTIVLLDFTNANRAIKNC